jgi:hypothetical protein
VALYLIIWLNNPKRSKKDLLAIPFSIMFRILFSGVFINVLSLSYQLPKWIAASNLLSIYMPYLSGFYEIFVQFYLRHSFAVFVLGFLGLIVSKSKKWVSITLALLLFLFLDIFIFYPLQLYISFYTRTVFCLFAGFFIFKSYNTSRNRLLVSLVLSIFIIDVLFYQSYLFQVWANPNDPLFEHVNGGRFYDWEKLNLTRGIFAFQFNPHFVETIDHINGIDNHSSRILVEDSVNREWGGYVVELLGVYTDSLIIGGLYTTFPGRTSTSDSVVLNKHINDYTIDEFQDKLDIFNIEYIFAWSDDFKDFLESHPDNFKSITNTSDGFANMYQYLQAPESFVLIESGEVNLTFERDLIQIDLNDVVAGEEMILKFVWHPSWHVFYENEELEILNEEDVGFMQITLPQSGDYSLVLRFL